MQARALMLHKQGMSPSHIMRETGVPSSTYYRWITSWEESGDVETIAREKAIAIRASDLQHKWMDDWEAMPASERLKHGATLNMYKGTSLDKIRDRTTPTHMGPTIIAVFPGNPTPTGDTTPTIDVTPDHTE